MWSMIHHDSNNMVILLKYLDEKILYVLKAHTYYNDFILINIKKLTRAINIRIKMYQLVLPIH